MKSDVLGDCTDCPLKDANGNKSAVTSNGYEGEDFEVKGSKPAGNGSLNGSSGDYNIVEAANKGYGRNDENRRKADMRINGVGAVMAVGAAPIIPLVAMEAGPALMAGYLSNPMLWNTAAMEGLLAASGYNGPGISSGWGAMEQGVANTGRGFKSFTDFKKAMGPAGPGQAWHHIVEQHEFNIAQFGPEAIHNTNNLIKLEHGARSWHQRISDYYSSKDFFTNGQTVRNWLKTQSFNEQYDFGIKAIERFK